MGCCHLSSLLDYMVFLKIKITRYFTIIWDSRLGENPRLILSRHQAFRDEEVQLISGDLIKALRA